MRVSGKIWKSPLVKKIYGQSSTIFFIVLVLYWEVKPILGNPKMVQFWVGNTIPILYRPALVLVKVIKCGSMQKKIEIASKFQS